MLPAPIPENEAARLDAVREMAVLDTPPEERFDRLTKKALEVFDVPISAITIIDKDREWFKSCQGIGPGCESPRATSICGHAMLADNMFIVEDTLKDERFADNPFVVSGQKIRFYAGMRLFNRARKLPIGVFCIKDTRPRKFSTQEVSALLQLAEQAESELNKNISSN